MSPQEHEAVMQAEDQRANRTAAESYSTGEVAAASRPPSMKVEVPRHAQQHLLEAEDVAQITGLKLGAIYRMAHDHKIPTVRLGRYRRFRPEAIAKWLEELES